MIEVAEGKLEKILLSLLVNNFMLSAISPTEKRSISEILFTKQLIF